MPPAIIDGVTIGKDGYVAGHPNARFVEQAPGPPVHGAVLMLLCDDPEEFDTILEMLPSRGFRNDFFSRIGDDLYHFTSSRYGMHLFSGSCISYRSGMLAGRCVPLQKRPDAATT